MQSGKLKRARLLNKKAKRGIKYVTSSTIVKKETAALKNLPKEALDEETIEDKCDFCQKGSNENKWGESEDLLFCKDCSAKAHPTCMEYGTELAVRTKLAPWQCINCKTCTVCGDSENAETMLFCDFCDKGYHMSCHNPRVIEQPLGKWACQECAAELSIGPDVTTDKTQSPQGESSNQENGESGKGMDQRSPNRIEEDNEQCLTPDGFLENYPQFIPDATNWTVQDVERFVAKVGFPEQARAFRDQEIDGKSLLLMKRSDVLTALSIRLGPALKIYKHVERLQLFLGSGLQP